MKIIGTKSKMPVVTGTMLRFGLVLLMIGYISCKDKKEAVNESTVATETTEVTDVMTVRENNSTVAEFVSFVEGDDNKMSLDHEYTNQALRKLIEATDAMAAEIDYNVKADLELVREHADKITRDPFATTHADNIRNAADIITGVLEKMQQAKYPGLKNDIGELKEACGSIDPQVLTLEQKDAVKSFFSKCAEVLEKMN